MQKKKTFELGRGAKLFQLKHWHQFILDVDFQNRSKPFIVAKVDNGEEIFRKNIDFDELRSKEWEGFLKNCECLSLIEEFAKHPSESIRRWKAREMSSELYDGPWISKEEIGVLNYNSNHGNWIDSRDIPGYFKFNLNLYSEELKNCSVEIPVEYTSGGPGYYSIYNGRFELTFNQILIWQNDIFSTRIKYKLENEVLDLELFGNKISFIKSYNISIID